MRKSKQLYGLILMVALALFACSGGKDAPFRGEEFRFTEADNFRADLNFAAALGTYTVNLVITNLSNVPNLSAPSVTYNYEVTGDVLTLRNTDTNAVVLTFTIGDNRSTLTGITGTLPAGTGSVTGLVFVKR
ncbi:MAG: hypothetical protein FWE37_08395 [Spirochaetaceae bacterium]|nr:hypothetical protein [Spirochaetaceae bacterium]